MSFSREPDPENCNNREFKQCYDRYTELWEKGRAVEL